jgi:hypothetical protein
MDDTGARSPSHLTRLSRYLLASGAIALAVGTFLQWDAVENGGSINSALAAQVLMVLGTAALTGAAFGYVLLAVRRDRDEAGGANEPAPDAEWLE